MDVGIGLPNAVPGTSGDELVEFARRADEAGFSTFGTIDRLVYPSYDPLVALSAAAAVGVAVGPREDDYEVAGVPSTSAASEWTPCCLA